MKKRLLFYLVAIGLSCGALFAIVYDTYYPPLKRIQRDLGMPIPEDAEDVQAQYTWGFQGGSFHLQFGIAPANLEVFRAELCGEQEFNTEQNRWAQIPWSTRPDWWLTNPESITVSVRCLAPGASIDIFVDESDASLYRVYIRGSE